MSNLFVRSWRGQASLAAAFWVVYFIVGLLLAIALIVIFRLVSAESDPQQMLYIKGLIFPYTLYSAICVWRCAKNSSLVWNILARIIVALAVIFGFYYVLQALHIV